jgi:hypothetical protein
MNKQRRAVIAKALSNAEEALSALESARDEYNNAKSLIDDALADIENARDEEQEYYDNMPESIQQGEKGDNASECADALDEACSETESAQDAVGEIDWEKGVDLLQAAKDWLEEIDADEPVDLTETAKDSIENVPT